MKKIVIVGNGQIRGDHGEFVDRCDTVIRMNKFQVDGYEEKVGTKIDVYSTYPGCCMKNIGLCHLREDLTRVTEVWFPRPETWCWCFPEYSAFVSQYDRIPQYPMARALWRSILREADQTDLLTDDQELISQWVKVGSDKSQIGPSTGLGTIEMALMKYTGHEVFILGFDGDKIGDWYWAKNPVPSSRHPWAWERARIASYAQRGLLSKLT